MKTLPMTCVGPSWDERAVTITVMAGPHYSVDNIKVYDEWKALIVDGPGWTYVRPFDKAKDGRKAVLALKKQCEGENITQLRTTQAYTKLETAKWEGAKRDFTWDKFVQKHADAHSELEEYGEIVSEQRKVTVFLKGISDPALANAMDIVRGTALYKNNLDECQRFLGGIIADNVAAGRVSKRNLSAVGGDRDDGSSPNKKKKARQGGKDKKGGKKAKDDGRTEPNAQDLDPNNTGSRPFRIWKLLDADLRKRISDNRDKKESASSGKKVRFAAASSKKGDDDDESTESESPADQFGRNGKGKKKGGKKGSTS